MQEDEAPSSVDGLREHLDALLRGLRSSRSDASCPERLIGKRKASSLPLPSSRASFASLAARFPSLLEKVLRLNAFPGWAELCHVFWEVFCEAWSDAGLQEKEHQLESFVLALSNHSLLDYMEGLELIQYLLLLDHLSDAVTRSRTSHAAVLEKLVLLRVNALDAFRQMELPRSTGLFFVSGTISRASRDGTVAFHALQMFNQVLRVALRCEPSGGQTQPQALSLAALESPLSSLLAILTQLSSGLRAALLGLSDNDADIFQALVTLVQLEARLEPAVFRYPDLAVLTDLHSLLTRTCSTSADLFLSVCFTLLHCDRDVVIDLLISPETVFLTFLLSFCKHFHWSDVATAATRCGDSTSAIDSENTAEGSSVKQRRREKTGVIIWSTETKSDATRSVPLSSEAGTGEMKVHPDEWMLDTEACLSPRQEDPLGDSVLQLGRVDPERLQALFAMLHSLADKLSAMHRLGLLPFEPAALCTRIRRFLSS